MLKKRETWSISFSISFRVVPSRLSPKLKRNYTVKQRWAKRMLSFVKGRCVNLRGAAFKGHIFFSLCSLSYSFTTPGSFYFKMFCGVPIRIAGRRVVVVKENGPPPLYIVSLLFGGHADFHGVRHTLQSNLFVSEKPWSLVTSPSIANRFAEPLYIFSLCALKYCLEGIRLIRAG